MFSKLIEWATPFNPRRKLFVMLIGPLVGVLIGQGLSEGGMSDTARVLNSGPGCPELKLVEGAGDARAIAWPGVGSKLRSMARIKLEAGAATVRLAHEMEAVYCAISGTGIVEDPDLGHSQPLIKGSMVHVEPGTAYRFVSDPGGMELVGGPCPPDPALYRDFMAGGAG